MDVVDEVKRRLDIVDIVGRHAQLRKAGRNYSARCPFHTERTPSFYVFPETGTWRCFGQCGEGGDIFTFVQKAEGLDFREALTQLAAQAGVPLSQADDGKRARHDRLSSALEAAVDWYQSMLRSPEGEAARAYLTERNIRPDTIAQFGMGWAPNEWRLLFERLRGAGFQPAEIIDAGLAIQPEGDRPPYDRMRGRVIIPIRDERGRLVGLGGRSIDGSDPKYLNTPQSELFDKGRTLFGLWEAKSAIRESSTAVVVEGYMDVIGPAQSGFANMVATMGTSLTEGHARLLGRYATRIIIAMDADAAGLKAAERAGTMLLGMGSVDEMASSVRSVSAVSEEHDIDLRVAPLTSGMDPDEMTRTDPEGWQRALDEARPFVVFLLDRVLGDKPPESAVETRRAIERLRPILFAVRDPIERAQYVQRVAMRLGVPEQAVRDRLATRAPAGRSPVAPARRQQPTAPATVEIQPRRGPAAEDWLLAILVRHPELRDELAHLNSGMMDDVLNRALFEAWREEPTLAAIDADSEHMLTTRLKELRAYRLPSLAADQARLAAQEKLRTIADQQIRRRRQAINEHLAEAERTHGVRQVDEVGAIVWSGGSPSEEMNSIADAVVESLELGRSMHQWDDDL